MKSISYLFLSLLLLPTIAASSPGKNFIQIEASDKYQRTELQGLGIEIEAVMSDSVYGAASDEALAAVGKAGYRVLESFPLRATDFPQKDSRFHNYTELTAKLDELAAAYPAVMRKFSIGRTVEGREIWAVQLNTSEAGGAGVSMKPGVVFLGEHHAREHVSGEIPLMQLEYLVRQYGVDRDITALLDKRDVYFIPMVNPDGTEYDIASARYRMHRKNMRPNGTRNPGVDLNRNYGYHWGGQPEETSTDAWPWPRRGGNQGSSSDPGDETYRGPAPFSEPETQAVKSFIESRPNIKVLLTYHTYSELILYPWGWTYDPIATAGDRATFSAMARTMAGWNHYKPQQSSDLYIATGDTTDWAYGKLGIFAFTFELSPRDSWGGGFYPGAGILDRVFDDNLKPALYLIELADDPHRSRLKADDRLQWLLQR